MNHKFKISIIILITIAFLTCIGIDAWLITIEPHNTTNDLIGSGAGVLSFKIYIDAIIKIIKEWKNEKTNK